MQVGDKVVCISHNTKFISYGKIYDIISIYNSQFTWIFLIDDNLDGSFYNLEDFKLLPEYRNDLINEICK